MKRLINREKGFTLIEIVIVLAIAAFIILLVFLAVSGAQKSKRDTETRQSAGEVGSLIENYESNNNGAGLTSALSATSLTNDKSGAGITPSYVAASATGQAATSSTGIIYSGDAVCTGTAGNYSTTGAAATDYAVSYWSESGNTAACLDDQNNG